MVSAGARKARTTPCASLRRPPSPALWENCPHAFLHPVGPGRRPAGRADGQFGGGPSQHRRGPRSSCRILPRISDADRRRAKLGADGAAAKPFIDEAESLEGDMPPDGACLARRRAFASGPCRRPWRAMLTRRRRADAASMFSPTDATRRRARRAEDRKRRLLRRRCRRARARRHGDRAILCDGSRQPLGARVAGLRRDRRRARATRVGLIAVAAVEASYARRRKATSSSSPSILGDYAGRSGTATARLCFNFRADRVRELLAALLDPAFKGLCERKRVAQDRRGAWFDASIPTGARAA